MRISGTPTVTLRAAFSKPKANLTAVLISYPGTTGNGTILTRGWQDPENPNSTAVTEPLAPGTFRTFNFDMQPKDVVVAAGPPARDDDPLERQRGDGPAGRRDAS